VDSESNATISFSAQAFLRLSLTPVPLSGPDPHPHPQTDNLAQPWHIPILRKMPDALGWKVPPAPFSACPAPSWDEVGQALSEEVPVLLAAVGSPVASSAPALCPYNVIRT